MEAKKISFGFSKTAKKVNLQAGTASGGNNSKQKDGEKIELVSCLEGQSIKIVGKENEDDGPKPLVIPLREQDKSTIPVRLAKLQEIKEGRGAEGKVKQEPLVPMKKETLEQKAAREILEDLKERNERSNEGDSNFVVPLKPEDLPLDGGREASMEDYESVPIEKFGMAMLRGMGWKEDPNAPKRDDKLPDGPVLRPKGMGLGAERAPKDKSRQLIPPAKDEVLEMRRGAMVKVLAGKHKDTYGTVESLDEENGRVMLRFALGGNQESLNEYLLQLVSKAEYSKYSKVLNAAKYEEYKNRKPTTTTTTIKEEKPEERKIKREPSDSPPPKPQSSRSDRQNEVERKHQKDHRSHSYSRSPSREERHNRKDRRDDREDRYDRDSRQISDRNDRGRERRSRSCEEQRDRRVGHANNRDNSEDKSERGRSRHHHKSSTRTSSGTKKKSHKYKQRRDHSRERAHSSDEDDRHHKKKTKKSKKQRSRSRSRR